MNMQPLKRQTMVSAIALHQPDIYRSGLRLALLVLLLCLVSSTRASALKGGGIFTPSSPEEIGPIGPQYESVVSVPQNFTIPDRGSTYVSLRWWNQGAPHTHVTRSINGGPWLTIHTYGALPVNTYIDFQDVNAAINAENCYMVVVSDGSNPWSALSTPIRCAFTRDGLGLAVHRLQLWLRVADVAGAGTDDDVEVRLQSPSWLVPTVTNWHPAGNSTWIDSTVNDFERGSERTYDLMLTNISQMSDITMITMSKTGDDDLCIAEFTLLIDGQPAYQRQYGEDAATCAWVTADHVVSASFADLRGDHETWNTVTSLPTFTGLNGAGLLSVIEAIFAHNLHGDGELRNGGITTARRLSPHRLQVAVPIIVHDVLLLGDVESTVSFDLVMTPVTVADMAQVALMVENVDADSSDLLGVFLPILGWKILYETSETIEAKLLALDPYTLDPSPLPETYPCFTSDAGIGLCYDTSTRRLRPTSRVLSRGALAEAVPAE